MNDLIIELFKYFSKFVPKDVLKTTFIQQNASKKTGYDEIKSEILASADESVIPEIEKFVLSINESFISDKIKNSNGIILFVEYGKMNLDRSKLKGLTQALAITVAYNFSDKNNDNLNEIILMNQCLEILDRIIRRMAEEQEALEFCANSELISYPVEIQPVDPSVFYGCAGWCAMFTNSKTDLI